VVKFILTFGRHSNISLLWIWFGRTHTNFGKTGFCSRIICII